MRRGTAALAASVSTVPIIAVTGMALALLENRHHQAAGPADIGAGSVAMAVGGLFFAFGLLAMVTVGFPSLWMTASLLPSRPGLRTSILIGEGAVIGLLYFTSVNTPNITDGEDVGVGGSPGGIAALSSSLIFSLFRKGSPNV